MRELLMALAILTVAAPARANDEPLSRQHFERGRALTRLGEHRAAIKEFELAFQSNPRPSILYNLAFEHRILAEAGAVDEMRKSVEFFQRYLQAQPHAPDHRDVETQIAELKARIEAGESQARELPTKEYPPTPVKTAVDDAPHSEEVPPAAIVVQPISEPALKPPPKRKKWLWVTLGIAGGAVVAGTAIGLGVGLSQHSVPDTSLGTIGVHYP